MRGLKLSIPSPSPATYGRTPRWVRGLKSIKVNKKTERDMSHPTMGAWIEILIISSVMSDGLTSHPTMGAWIEIINGVIYSCDLVKSHPTMGAWIEIYFI